MLLKHLFQESEISPGEKRPRLDIRIRDIRSLEDRITQIQDHIYSSEVLKNKYKSDPQLSDSLERLIKRLSSRKDQIQKLTQHPTRSQTKMVEILKSECSEYLDTWRQLNPHDWATPVWLLRGSKTQSSVFEGRSRIDRRPKDSTTDLSEILDEHLEKMGIRALRRNSIFVTTSMYDAKQYGDRLHMIFPKNGFHFMSTDVGDLVLDNVSKLMDQHLVTQYMQAVTKWVQDSRGTWDIYWPGVEDLTRGIRWHSVTEVHRSLKILQQGSHVHVPEHLMIDLKDLITTEGIRAELHPQQTDLVTPMQNQKEILINGEYWALEFQLWNQYLFQALR